MGKLFSRSQGGRGAEGGGTHYGRHQLRNARQHPARGAARVFSSVRTALFRGYKRSYRESRCQTLSRDENQPRLSLSFFSFSSYPPPLHLSLFLSYLSSWENQRGCMRTCIPIHAVHVLFMLIVCFLFRLVREEIRCS